MIPYDHFVEAAGLIRKAIRELDNARADLPAETPGNIVKSDHIFDLCGNLEDVHTTVTSWLGDILYYNQHAVGDN